MHTKKHLSFNALRKMLSRRFLEIADFRQEGKVEHGVHEVLMSGFAMMFYQDSSLLQFQQKLQEVIDKNNLQTLFEVESIPKDSQMREVIDLIFCDEPKGLGMKAGWIVTRIFNEVGDPSILL